jgi:hypothetical protein
MTINSAADQAIYQLQMNRHEAVYYVMRNANTTLERAQQAVEQTLMFHK